MSARIAGELAVWPSKECLAGMLGAAGLQIEVGQYSVRVLDCSHFIFQQYGGDLGDPIVDADAETVEDLVREGRLVSVALAWRGDPTSVEIYNDRLELCDYLHHNWPLL